MQQSPSWEANQCSASQEIPQTWRFITAFTNAPQLSLSWASSIQSIFSHHTSSRFILLLSTHLHIALPSGLFPSGFPTKILYTPLLSPYVLHALPISFFSIWSHEKYWVSSTNHCFVVLLYFTLLTYILTYLLTRTNNNWVVTRWQQSLH